MLRFGFLTGGLSTSACSTIAGTRLLNACCCSSLCGNRTPFPLIAMFVLMLYSEYQYESHVASCHPYVAVLPPLPPAIPATSRSRPRLFRAVLLSTASGLVVPGPSPTSPTTTRPTMPSPSWGRQ